MKRLVYLTVFIACMVPSWLVSMQEEGQFFHTSMTAPPAIFKEILRYVGDQSDSEKKFENFKTLLRCKQVNTFWKKCAQEVYDQLQASQMHESEIHAVSVMSRFVGRNNDVEIICNAEHSALSYAIMKNNILALHHIFSKKRELLDVHLYKMVFNLEPFGVQEFEVTPILLAEFCDAYASKNVIVLLEQENCTKALSHKEAFQKVLLQDGVYLKQDFLSFEK